MAPQGLASWSTVLGESTRIVNAFAAKMVGVEPKVRGYPIFQKKKKQHGRTPAFFLRNDLPRPR